MRTRISARPIGKEGKGGQVRNPVDPKRKEVLKGDIEDKEGRVTFW